MDTKTKQTIGILLVCQFLICLGLSLIFPVMPFIKNEYHFTAFEMGLMSSLFAFVQFIGSPIVGRISDKAGRKPMIVWGLLIFAIAQFIFAVAGHLMWFNISRIFDGLSAAMIVPTSMALAADLTSLKDRAKVIGWLSASFSGGLILGPGIGGILANFGYKVPFWLAGILGLISMIIAWFFLPHDYEVAKNAHHETSAPENTWTQVKRLLSPAMTTALIMIFVAAFGLAGFESIYSLYVNEVHNFGLSAIALTLTLNGILSLILQVFFFEKLVIWLGETKLIRWSFFLSALGTLIVIYDHSPWQIIVATLIVFEAFDLLRPAITTLLTKMSETNQGLINGINMSLTSIGNIVGPLITGALLDVNYQIPYLLVVVFLMLAFLISFALSKLAHN